MRKIISIFLSFLIFVFLLVFITIKISKEVTNYDYVENYIESINVLDLKVKNLNQLFGLKINTNDNTLKDTIKSIGIYNGLTEEEIVNILNDEKFEKSMKQVILNWYKKSSGIKTNSYISPLHEYSDNKDFINDIENLFKQTNNIITSIYNTNTLGIIGIIIFLTIMIIFITKTLYYPLIFLGLPSLFVGIIYTTLKYNKTLFIDILKKMFLLSDNLTTLVINKALSLNIGLYLIILGLILTITFIIIKIKNDKILKQLEQTRRINIEEINMDGIKYN